MSTTPTTATTQPPAITWRSSESRPPANRPGLTWK